MINLQIKKTEQDLVDIVNNCNLPITVIELIFDKLSIELKRAVEEALKKEQEESRKSKESTFENDSIDIYPEDIEE